MLVGLGLRFELGGFLSFSPVRILINLDACARQDSQVKLIFTFTDWLTRYYFSSFLRVCFFSLLFWVLLLYCSSLSRSSYRSRSRKKKKPTKPEADAGDVFGNAKNESPIITKEYQIV